MSPVPSNENADQTTESALRLTLNAANILEAELEQVIQDAGEASQPGQIRNQNGEKTKKQWLKVVVLYYCHITFLQFCEVTAAVKVQVKVKMSVFVVGKKKIFASFSEKIRVFP